MIEFQKAMEESGKVLSELDQDPDKFDAARLHSLLATTEGARGFFVVLLAGDCSVADTAPALLVDAIKQAPEAALVVLTKNLVMSAATEVVHKRNGNTENAAGSARVLARTKRLVKLANTPELHRQSQLMKETLDGKSDAYAAFLARVNYDTEQRAAAGAALTEVLS